MKLSPAELQKKLADGDDLTGADLSGAKLKDLQAPGANLAGINLAKANLAKANLSGADLSGADLTAANLRGADLSKANLSGVKAAKAALEAADLSGARLDGTDLSGANLRKTKWDDVVATKTEFGGVDAVNSSGANASFAECTFDEANLAGTDWKGVSLVRSSLVKTNFQDSCLSDLKADSCILDDAVFSFAEIAGAVLNGCSLSGAEIYAATVSNTTFGDADLTKANLSATEFTDSDLSGATVEKANFKSVTGFDDSQLAEFKERGAVVSRKLAKRLGLFVLHSHVAKAVVLVVIAACAYYAYAWYSNPANWSFDRLIRATQEAMRIRDYESLHRIIDVGLDRFTDPNRNTQLRESKARALMNEGRLDEAIEWFGKTAENSENEGVIFSSEMGICDAMIRRGETAAAIAKLNELIEKWYYLPGVSQAFRRLAEAQYDAGDEAAAFATVDRFDAAYVDDPAAVRDGMRMRADLYRRADREEEALALYEKLLGDGDNGPEVNWTYTTIAQILTDLDRFDDAEKTWAEFTKRYPDNPEVKMAASTGRARILETRGDLPGAIAIYRDLIRTSTNPAIIVPTYGMLSSLYMRMNDTAEAEKIYSILERKYANVESAARTALEGRARLAEGVNDIDRALALYKEISERFPDDAGDWATISRVQILIRERRLDEASALIETALAKDGEPSRMTVNFLQAKSDIAVARGDVPGSIAILESLPEKYPNLVEPVAVNQAIAGRYESINEYDRALEYYRKTLEMPDAGPASVQTAKRGIAQILWVTGGRDESTKMLQEMLDECGDDFDCVLPVLNRLYQQMMANREIVKAEAYLNRLWDFSKSHPEIRSDILMRKAEIDVRRGKRDEALAKYKSIMDEYAGTDAGDRAASSYANILMDVGREDEAEALFRERTANCTSVVGACRPFYDGLARVYETTGRYDEALELMNRFKETYGDAAGSDWIDDRIAGLYMQLGEVDRAMDLYRDFIENCDADYGRCAHSYQRMADNAADHGDFDEAIRLQRMAIEKLSGRAGAEGLQLNLANLMERKGDVATAEKLLKEVVATGGDDFRESAQIALARLYRDRGDFDRAMAILEKLSVSEEDSWVSNDAVGEIAGIYRQKGEYTKALQIMQDLVTKIAPDAPRRANVMGTIADLYFEMGETEKGIQELRSIVENSTKGGQAWIRAQMNLAAQYRRFGRGDESEKILDMLDEDQSTGPRIRALIALDRARVYMNDRRFDEAMKWLDEALARSDDRNQEIQISLNQARILAAQNKLDVAEAKLESVLARLAELSQSGLYESALEQLAGLKMKKGEVEEAIKLYGQIVDLNTDPVRRAQARLQIVRSLLREKRDDEAEAILDRISSEKIEDIGLAAAVDNEYSNLAMARNDWAAAFKYQEKLLAVSTNKRDAGNILLRIARLKERQGDWDAATPYYERILKEYADDPDLVNGAKRAMVDRYRRDGNTDEAIRILGELAASETDAGERNRIKLQIASIERDLGHIEKAATLFDELRTAASDDPALQDDIIAALAQLELRRNNREKALDYYKELLTRIDNPTRKRDTMLTMADLYSKIGDYGSAKEILNTVLSEAQRPSDSYFRAMSSLANLHRSMGEESEAAAIYKELIEAYPEEPSTARMAQALAHMYARMNRIDEAMALLNGLLKKNDGTDKDLVADVRINIAQLYKRMGNHEEATRILQSVAREFAGQRQGINAEQQLARRFVDEQQWDEARKAYDEIARKYGHITGVKDQVEMAFAGIAAATGDFETAAAIYGRFEQRFRGTERGGRALTALARLYMQYHKDRLATETYQRVIDEYGDVEDLANEARLSLAQNLTKAWEYEKAIDIYKAVIDASPNDIRIMRALSGLARTYEKTGRFEQAEGAYARMIDLNFRFKDQNSEMDALMGMADLVQRQKMYDEAVIRYDELIKKFPDHERAGWAMLKKAQIAFTRDDVKGAEALYIEVMKKFPNSEELRYNVLNGMAQIKIFQEDYNSAVEIYKKMVRDNRGKTRAGWAMFNLARVYLSEKELDKTVALLNQIVAEFGDQEGLIKAVNDMQLQIQEKFEPES